MKRWIVTILALNFIDAVSTLIAIEWLDIADETNPLMRVLLGTSPWLFTIFKLGISTLLLPIWNTPRTLAMLWALRGAAAFYAAIVLWHLINWLLVLSL